MTINARSATAPTDAAGTHVSQTRRTADSRSVTPLMRRVVLLISALALALTSTAAYAATAPNDTFWAQQWGPQQVRADVGIVHFALVRGHADRAAIRSEALADELAEIQLTDSGHAGGARITQV